MFGKLVTINGQTVTTLFEFSEGTPKLVEEQIEPFTKNLEPVLQAFKASGVSHATYFWKKPAPLYGWSVPPVARLFLSTERVY